MRTCCKKPWLPLCVTLNPIHDNKHPDGVVRVGTRGGSLHISMTYSERREETENLPWHVPSSAYQEGRRKKLVTGIWAQLSTKYQFKWIKEKVWRPSSLVFYTVVRILFFFSALSDSFHQISLWNCHRTKCFHLWQKKRQYQFFSSQKWTVLAAVLCSPDWCFNFVLTITFTFTDCSIRFDLYFKPPKTTYHGLSATLWIIYGDSIMWIHLENTEMELIIWIQSRTIFNWAWRGLVYLFIFRKVP